jgi:hypothetical protein
VTDINEEASDRSYGGRQAPTYLRGFMLEESAKGEQYSKWSCVRFMGGQVVNYLGVWWECGWDIEECHKGRVRPGRDEGAIGYVWAVDKVNL